jgi:hypothetical protein
VPFDVRRTWTTDGATLLKTLALFACAKIGNERKYTFQVEPRTFLRVSNNLLETEDVDERNELGSEAIHIMLSGGLAAKVMPGLRNYFLPLAGDERVVVRSFFKFLLLHSSI